MISSPNRLWLLACLWLIACLLMNLQACGHRRRKIDVSPQTPYTETGRNIPRGKQPGTNPTDPTAPQTADVSIDVEFKSLCNLPARASFDQRLACADHAINQIKQTSAAYTAAASLQTSITNVQSLLKTLTTEKTQATLDAFCTGLPPLSAAVAAEGKLTAEDRSSLEFLVKGFANPGRLCESGFKI